MKYSPNSTSIFKKYVGEKVAKATVEWVSATKSCMNEFSGQGFNRFWHLRLIFYLRKLILSQERSEKVFSNQVCVATLWKYLFFLFTHRIAGFIFLSMKQTEQRVTCRDCQRECWTRLLLTSFEQDPVEDSCLVAVLNLHI